MNPKELLSLFDKLSQGQISPKEALFNFQTAPFECLLNGLNLDHHRQARTGLGEVIFSQDKSLKQLELALTHLGRNNTPVLATRMTPEQGEYLLPKFPTAFFYPEARLFSLNKDLALDSYLSDKNSAKSLNEEPDELVVITAGSADLKVGLEALGTARFFNLKTSLISDIGVAGIHRLSPWLPKFFQAKILIVAAGMEGALPSVIAGLVNKPIIAVPTSVGYGTGVSGFAALFAMLNSCASGLSVVNIDNGFGAATFAVKLLQNI